jgi:hypothetical protein
MAYFFLGADLASFSAPADGFAAIVDTPSCTVWR